LLIRRSEPGRSAVEPSGAPRGDVELYVDETGTRRLAIRDGDAPAPGEASARILFSSGRFGAAGGPWLFHVGLWTPADFRDEFLAWYAVEHLPILLECRTWDGCRFVEEAVADGCQFYALHQMSDRSALDSEQRRLSRSTPWFLRLKANDWFDERFSRTLYRRAADASRAA